MNGSVRVSVHTRLRALARACDIDRVHVCFLLRHKKLLFRHNQFSTLFFSMKEAESGEIVIVSCIIDFKDKQV